MSLAVLDHEHQQILEEAQASRLAAERRHAAPGCPWGCEDGWRVIEEDQTPRPGEVVVGGILYTPCECNSQLVWRDSRYRSEVRRGLGQAT
jgi:hypothetical protein